MIRRLLTTAGVAAAVAFVVGGGAFAVASSPSGDGPAQTITVIEKSGSSHFVDVGKPGFSIGDGFTINSVFWNVGQTQRVGGLHGYCTVLRAQLARCVGTARLTGGSIEFSGNISDGASDIRIAVTGGTGALKGAEGQVTVHQLNADGSLSRDVIELIG
jgi:hypothetical protein